MSKLEENICGTGSLTASGQGQSVVRRSFFPRVGPGCVLCTRIDPLRFLAGCRRRQLNQGLVVALGFFSLDKACFCVIFFRLWVHALFSSLTFFVISTGVIDCLGRFVPEMTYYMSSGTLNLTKLNSTREKFAVSCRAADSLPRKFPTKIIGRGIPPCHGNLCQWPCQCI